MIIEECIHEQHVDACRWRCIMLYLVKPYFSANSFQMANAGSDIGPPLKNFLLMQITAKSKKIG